MAAKFRGDSNHYIDLATRGKQIIGLSLEYLTHMSVGCLVVRFVAHGEVKITPFNHFVVRESAKFVGLDDKGEATEKFLGVRLNKVLIPLIQPAVPRAMLEQFLIKFSLCEKVASWVADQVASEGFKLIDKDLINVVRNMLVDKIPDMEVVQEVNFPYPDLLAQKEAWIAYQAKKADADDEDDDDDEKVECKHTIN